MGTSVDANVGIARIASHIDANNAQGQGVVFKYVKTVNRRSVINASPQIDVKIVTNSSAKNVEAVSSADLVTDKNANTVS